METTLEIYNDKSYIYTNDAFRQILYESLSYVSAQDQNNSIYQKGWRPPTQQNNWDGVIRLTKWNGNRAVFGSGLLPRVYEEADKYSIQLLIYDYRDRPVAGDSPACDIPLWWYQREAHDRALEEGRGVLDMPPRSGKTRTMGAIVRSLWLPTIWACPTTGIKAQTVASLRELYGDSAGEYVYCLNSSRDVKNCVDKMVVVTTVALANNLSVAEFFHSRKVLVIDEFHHAASSTYHTLSKKCDQAYYRYGMTGTFFRSGNDALSMEAVLSKTIYKIDSSVLLDEGILVPTEVMFLPVEEPKVTYNKNVPWAKFATKALYEHDGRNKAVVCAAVDLVEKGYHTLVIAGRRDQAESLKADLELVFPPKGNSRFGQVEFVHSGLDDGHIKDIISAYLEGTIRLLIGTSIVGEGMDLPSCNALVFAKGGKASVDLKQSAYRVCTKSFGKSHSVMVDFTDQYCPILLKHARMRWREYSKDPVFSLNKLDDLDSFSSWLDSLEK